MRLLFEFGRSLCQVALRFSDQFFGPYFRKILTTQMVAFAPHPVALVGRKLFHREHRLSQRGCIGSFYREAIEAVAQEVLACPHCVRKYQWQTRGSGLLDDQPPTLKMTGQDESRGLGHFGSQILDLKETQWLDSVESVQA